MQKNIRFSFVAATLGIACLGTPLLSSVAYAQTIDAAAISGLPTWEPGRAVTTNIKDALPVIDDLRGVTTMEPKPIPDDWVLAPGYYRSTIRSYCLHAGTYGPTKGDGYLIAPLKGDRVPVIRDVLMRSTQFPNIEQSDVQRLIWGIEDGAQWDNFDNGFKSRVAPLLSPQEIALLNLEPKRAAVAGEVKKRLGGLIPGKAKDLVDNYAELRNKITGTTSFDELEKIAVKTGVAPWGKDSRKDVQAGTWAYVGDGFFIRAFPQGYQTTVLEVYRVAPAKLTKDAQGRITRFDSDGFIIDTTYADAKTNETVDGKSVPAWRFKTITFRHPDGRTHTVSNKGFVVAQGPGAQSGYQVASLSAVALRQGGDLGDMKHYEDGLEAAKDPSEFDDKIKWIQEHLDRVKNAWDSANRALRGDDVPPDPKPKKFDPSKHTATPANTGKQRLGMSGFKK
jgi:hypothetical protein